MFLDLTLKGQFKTENYQYIGTEMISYLPSLYTQKTVSEIHPPPGPDAHNSDLLWPKKNRHIS